MNNFLIWMRRTGLLCAGIVCTAIAITGTAQAATDTATQGVTATINPAASLSIGGAPTLTFASSVVGSGTLAGSATVTVTAIARTTSGHGATLTLSAPDLTDSSNTIASSNISWTVDATGTSAGFAAGTLSTAGTSLGTLGADGTSTGILTFSLADDATHPVGSYTTTLTYTLTAL